MGAFIGVSEGPFLCTYVCTYMCIQGAAHDLWTKDGYSNMPTSVKLGGGHTNYGRPSMGAKSSLGESSGGGGGGVASCSSFMSAGLLQILQYRS